jgi:hypothetical protein
LLCCGADGYQSASEARECNRHLYWRVSYTCADGQWQRNILKLVKRHELVTDVTDVGATGSTCCTLTSSSRTNAAPASNNDALPYTDTVDTGADAGTANIATNSDADAYARLECRHNTAVGGELGNTCDTSYHRHCRSDDGDDSAIADAQADSACGCANTNVVSEDWHYACGELDWITGINRASGHERHDGATIGYAGYDRCGRCDDGCDCIDSAACSRSNNNDVGVDRTDFITTPINAPTHASCSGACHAGTHAAAARLHTRPHTACDDDCRQCA